MKWSLKLGRIAGIGIYMHWTFLLLVGWIMLAHLGRGHSMQTALTGVLFILALFACVVLHELGHALTAGRYGIGTRDITLLPIGGVARLERMPDDPGQELRVALAGPAVNVVIALVLFVVSAAFYGLRGMTDPALLESSFVIRLMWVNLLLVAFNLLPAFPMDGGRVLRALLAQRMSRHRATEIAASVGQGMAIVFGVVGLFLNPLLIFIALFVYLGAQAESQMAGVEAAIKGLSAREAMVTRFRTLSVTDKLDRAIDELLAGSQQDFPVMSDGPAGEGSVAGLLRRDDVLKALARGGRDTGVADIMRRDCKVLSPGEPLEHAFQALREGGCGTLPVTERGRLVGLLTLENVAELMMIKAALGRSETPERLGRFARAEG